MIVKNGQREKVLLTFDDGPTDHLPEILSILKEEQVQALFFWQTNRLHQEAPWRRVLQEGHEIGTHTHSHPKLPELSRCRQHEEIAGSKEKLEHLLQRKIAYFRPPYGLYDETTIAVARQLDLSVVLWQVASWDWKHASDPENIVANVVQYTNAGDLVLLHELPQTVRVLKRLIRALKEKGLTMQKPHEPLFFR